MFTFPMSVFWQQMLSERSPIFFGDKILDSYTTLEIIKVKNAKELFNIL